MDEKIKYWSELSDYDLDTAEAMLTSARYLYVGFMCHQSIEKIFKAYFIYKSDITPPHSHNLSYLANKGKFYNELNELQTDFLANIEPLNIEARYPSHKERLLKSLTKEKAQELLNNTKDLQHWIKKKLL
jgi:HEPN domain-containing protein